MMVIGSQQLLQQFDHIPSISFIGKTWLKLMAQLKVLGTVVDSKLKCREHI